LIVAIIDELRLELYSGDNPFLCAQMKYVDFGYTHTNIAPKQIDSTLRIIRSAFWLEIGSMLGGSAIRTAEAVKRASIPTQIVRIDPFCGDVNMWAWERPLAARHAWRFLRVEDCRPTTYERFLANIFFQGHHDIILPIMTTSSVGLKLLSRLMQEQRLAVLPQVIYLDAAHEVDETFVEVRSSWALLPAGGVLFGRRLGLAHGTRRRAKIRGADNAQPGIAGPVRRRASGRCPARQCIPVLQPMAAGEAAGTHPRSLPRAARQTACVRELRLQKIKRPRSSARVHPCAPIVPYLFRGR
jgi:hypothetical protein